MVFLRFSRRQSTSLVVARPCLYSLIWPRILDTMACIFSCLGFVRIKIRSLTAEVKGETHLSLDGLEVVLLPPALWLVVVRDVTVLDCFSDLDKLVDAELSPDGVGVRDEVWRVVFEVGELRRRRERQERLQQCIGRISYVPYSCKGLSSAGLWCVGERGDGPGQWSRSMARATSRRRGGE